MSRAMRVCTTNGCPELTKSGKCKRCQRKVSRQRGSTEQRGYGAAWQAVRSAFLAEFPQCFDCGSRHNLTVDHVDGDVRNRDWSNLATRCRSCHGRKSYRENQAFGRVTQDGKPLDSF